jgi:hypothetical protein
MIFLGDNDQNYNKNNINETGLDYLNKVMYGSNLFCSVELSGYTLRSKIVQEYLIRKSFLSP